MDPQRPKTTPKLSRKKKLLFSVITNGYKCGDPDAMAALDAFAATLSGL